MNTVEFAESELVRMGFNTGDEIDKSFMQAVLELVRVFFEQEHSGMNASWVLSLFNRFSNYKPFAPLTGKDDEWNDVSELAPGMLQNKRCPAVFKNSITGEAIYQEMFVFKRPGGACYTNKSSSAKITFPFNVPNEPIIILVDKNDVPIPNITTPTDYEAFANRYRKCETRQEIMDQLLTSTTLLQSLLDNVDVHMSDDVRTLWIQRNGDILFHLTNLITDVNKSFVTADFRPCTLQSVMEEDGMRRYMQEVAENKGMNSSNR